MIKNIAFAAPTWIRTPQEKDIVLETMRILQSYQLPIIIVDAGSSKDDQKLLQNISHSHFFEETGGLTKQLVTSHRNAAKLADYIFYLQTDKPDFAKDVVPRMLSFYDTLDEKGLLIPSRTKESLDTYPAFQKQQEAFLNFFVGDYVGKQEDYFCGPKIFPKTFVPYLDKIIGEIGWGIESFYYVLAKRFGIPFDFISCFITAPADIEEEEKTKQYRLLGTSWQIDGFLQAQKLLL